MQINVGCTVECDGFRHLGAARAAIGGARNIVLIAHANADGDAVGSVGGAYALLRRCTDADLHMVLPTGCPQDYDWLPNAGLIINGEAEEGRARQLLAHADLVIGTDFNAANRLNHLEEPLLQSAAYKILIDHHHDPATEQFDVVFSAPEISSACELAYWTLRAMFGPDAFDADAAACLYTGMRTDTGGMAFSNTQPSLYLATAELMGRGIDPTAINRNINNTFSPQRLRFYGHAFKDLLAVYPAQGKALMVIGQADMEAHGVKSADLTGLINEVMRLRDVECAVLVREEADRVRLSLRSKTDTDVNQLARSLFDGGGHTRAAGATSHLSLADTVTKVKQALGLPL